jgi:hypothetical protein
MSIRQTVNVWERKEVWQERGWGKKNRVKYHRYHGQEYTGHQLKSENWIRMYQHNCRHKCNNNFTKVSWEDIYIYIYIYIFFFFWDFSNFGSLALLTSFWNKCFIKHSKVASHNCY